jgi:hypothetical protein
VYGAKTRRTKATRQSGVGMVGMILVVNVSDSKRHEDSVVMVWRLAQVNEVHRRMSRPLSKRAARRAP